MQIVFGLLAILLTLLNISYSIKKQENNILFMALALSFTALTMMAFHHQISSWVKSEDWIALMDVVPTMNSILWLLVLISIIVNLGSIFVFKGRN